MQTSQLLNLFHSLLSVRDRKESAARIAQALSAISLMVFLYDAEIEEVLPAPGFPQTLPGSARWRDFISSSLKTGIHESWVIDPYSNEALEAIGIANSDRTVFVLLGGDPDREGLDNIKLLLPFIAHAMRGEQLSERADAELARSRASVSASEQLAHTLDITRSELRRALFHAENASRAKDEFLAVVSHELRSPLNAILGWTQMLQLEDLGAEDRAQALETIERNAKLQAQLIEDILDYERILTGKVRLDLEPVNIADPVNAAIESIQPALTTKGLEITTDLSSDAGPIAGDPTRIQQIVWNLLTNAMKFTPKGGVIHVTLKRVDSHIELSVCDTGKGIAPDFLPYVFDRFRQADATSTRSQGGLGLGLAIVRHLAEMHCGTIEVASEGSNKGATFTLKLPIMVAEPSLKLEKPPHMESTESDLLRNSVAFDNVKILVLDDNADARTLLDKLLTKHGATVVVAASVQNALQLLPAEHPDVIISDIEMPDEDGITYIRAVRSHEDPLVRNVQAIALTAHARPSDRQEALSAGFDAHQTKPFEANDLLRLISSLMESHKLASDTEVQSSLALSVSTTPLEA